MIQYNVGDHIFLNASMFLKNNRTMPESHTQCSEGDIVKTKYGPQLTCKVTAVRLKGLSVEVLAVDGTKAGHYSEWPEYLEIANDDSLAYCEKVNKMREVLG